VEPGFSISHPRASGVYFQPPIEPPISATAEGDQECAAQPPSPFFSLLPLLVMFYAYSSSFVQAYSSHILDYDIYFPFCPAYEASPSDLAPDDSFADMSEPEGTSLSVPYTDLILASLCASFISYLSSSVCVSTLIHRLCRI
jgi:hypothetical protein